MYVIQCRSFESGLREFNTYLYNHTHRVLLEILFNPQFF